MQIQDHDDFPELDRIPPAGAAAQRLVRKGVL